MSDSSFGVLIGAAICLGFLCLVLIDKNKRHVDPQKQELDYRFFLDCVELICDMFDFFPQSRQIVADFCIKEKKGILDQYYKQKKIDKNHHMGRHAAVIVKVILEEFVDNVGPRHLHPELRDRLIHDAWSVKSLDPVVFGNKVIGLLAQKRLVDDVNSRLTKTS